MNMTHYMQLLADNQPWNLLIYMVVPVLLAETVAVTELFVLFKRATQGPLVAINRAAGILGGAYFAAVFVQLLFSAAIPLTLSGQWRGPADVVAVGFYLAGVVPLVTLALLDLRWLGRGWAHERRLWWHASAVAVFLVVAHIAMIFGMLDPTVLGAAPAADSQHLHP